MLYLAVIRWHLPGEVYKISESQGLATVAFYHKLVICYIVLNV